MIRKEAWPFHRTISGVRICWGLEEPKGPKGPLCNTKDSAVLWVYNKLPRMALEWPRMLVVESGPLSVRGAAQRSHCRSMACCLVQSSFFEQRVGKAFF